METTRTVVLYAGIAAVVLYALYRRFTKPSLADLPGPEPESFLMGASSFISLLSVHTAELSTWAFAGNLRDLFQRQVGEADFRWQEQYGHIVRLKASLSVRGSSSSAHRGTHVLSATDDCRAIICGSPTLKRCSTYSRHLATTSPSCLNDAQSRGCTLGTDWFGPMVSFVVEIASPFVHVFSVCRRNTQEA